MTRSLRTSLRGALLLVALLAISQRASAQLTYTWTGTEPTMPNRLGRNGVASVPGTPKPFPGAAAQSARYTTFTFNNASPSTQTFTAAFVGESGNFQPFFSLYLDSFDPSNLASNYLGDSGNSCLGTPCSLPTQFGVNVAAGATVVLVANSAVGILPTAGATFTYTAGFSPTSTVPEPSTYALLAKGLAGLGFAARRRARQ